MGSFSYVQRKKLLSGISGQVKYLVDHDHQPKLAAVVSLEELTFRALAHLCSDSGLKWNWDLPVFALG